MPDHVLPRSVTLSAAGAGTVRLELDNPTVVWDISQLSVQTNPTLAGCTATVFLDGYYHCATVAGSGDTAQGPPDISLNPGQVITVVFANGPPAGTGLVYFYYDESPRLII